VLALSLYKSLHFAQAEETKIQAEGLQDIAKARRIMDRKVYIHTHTHFQGNIYYNKKFWKKLILSFL
jgi:hypothetical protein